MVTVLWDIRSNNILQRITQSCGLVGISTPHNPGSQGATERLLDVEKIKLENHPWQWSPCTPAKPTTTSRLMVASRVIKAVQWNASAWVSEQH